MYTQNNTLEEQEKFILSYAEISNDFTNEELVEDMAGLRINFPRVKIPAGGALQFEIPSNDPENPDYEKNLVGVIVHNHDSYAYWPQGREYDENTIPLCSSINGKQGIGEPGGACVVCGLNRFGTALEGRGKACKNMRILYLLRSGDYMPLQIILPPTSLSPFCKFMNQSFMIRRRATYGSVVQISLKKMSNGRDDYSVATFRLLYDLEGEELAQIRNYTNNFKEQIREILKQHTTMTIEQRATICDCRSEATEKLPVGTNEHFCISSVNEAV